MPESKSVGGRLISLITFLILLNLFVLPALRPDPKQVPYRQYSGGGDQPSRSFKPRSTPSRTSRIFVVTLVDHGSLNLGRAM